MAEIKLESVAKSFGAFSAVKDVSFAIDHGSSIPNRAVRSADDYDRYRADGDGRYDRSISAGETSVACGPVNCAPS